MILCQSQIPDRVYRCDEGNLFNAQTERYDVHGFRLTIYVLITLLLTGAYAPVHILTADIVSPDPIHYATDNAELVYRDVSEESYLNFVKNLTSFGPRSIYDPTNGQVRDWIVSTLENISNSRLDIEIWGSWYNIIGKLPGSAGNAAPAFMVGAHYDTVPDAPGANDDGSGVATCLELVRVMSKYNWTNDIYFCFWNAEEYGLIGSTQCASDFFDNEIDILIYFNIDMILVQDESAPADERVFFFYSTDYETDLAESVYTTYNDAEHWADLCRAMNNNYDTPIINPVPHTYTTFWERSDQYALWSVGYKGAIFAFQSSFTDPDYHTPNDRWDNPNYDYSIGAAVTASIGAAIAHAQGRTLGQAVHDRYSLIIGSGVERRILFPMTLDTGVSVLATTNEGTDLTFLAVNDIYQALDSSSPELASMNHYEVLDFETSRLGQHEIRVTNEGSSAVEVQIEIIYEADLEGDSQPDSSHNWYNRFHADQDNDQISDAMEMALNIDRFCNDSDHDSLLDWDEQYIYSSFPFSADSDSDEMSDPWEIMYGLDPRSRFDRLDDPDADDLYNIQEYREGTNPRLNDSDHDSILDGYEVKVYGTSPLSSDSDHDHMPDAFEIQYGLNPLRDDANEDLDGDGVTNLDEYYAGSNPSEAPVTTTTSSNGLLMEVGISAASIAAVVGLTIIVAAKLRRQG